METNQQPLTPLFFAAALMMVVLLLLLLLPVLCPRVLKIDI